ncbi:uncharacterized protein LOC108089339 [Drosophila ficusphila]|uniref:uncharacterized protein LOC108089339 n=1 Tax=Drosophila ficusphila TaxID=30025 RepID=UPI0007E5D447|nr:uncharacterized protein LOC108089339 [Drosophila ficusphila]
MKLMVRLQFVGLVLAIVILREIRAREPITIPDVGQIIKDLDGLQIDGTAIERGAPCRVDMQKDLPPADKVQPLYLRPGTDLYWLPNDDGQLEVPRGAIIELHCSQPFAPANGESLDAELRSIRVKCVQDTIFEWSGAKIKFRDFVCSHSIPYTVEQLDRRCGKDATSFQYRVGYDIGDGRFVATMELCHDPDHLRTHYARHQMTPANVHFQKNVKRLKFSTAGHFTGFDMARIYSHKSQEKLLTAAPGLIDVKAGLFLARGHLAAKADLIFASQQRSSFNYVNVAPQWQSFNGGQWAVLEDSTRRYVARSGISATVYTGTFGEMKLAGSRTLHLTTDANNRGMVAVPQLFYRVLIDNGNPTRGIALLGVNNPHATMAQIHESYIICDPVEEQVEWLGWLHKSNAKGNLKKGYLYACSVADLAMAVAELPRPLLQVDQLLT